MRAKLLWFVILLLTGIGGGYYQILHHKNAALPSWNNVQSSSSGFSATFPKSPKTIYYRTETLAGTTEFEVLTSSFQGSTFFIGSTQLPEEKLQSMDMNDILAIPWFQLAESGYSLDKNHLFLMNETKLCVSSEWLDPFQNHRLINRNVLNGNRLIIVGVEFPKWDEQKIRPFAERFINSFSIKSGRDDG